MSIISNIRSLFGAINEDPDAVPYENNLHVMKVGELITALENYLYENKKERYLQRLYYDWNATIDCVYYRKGGVILQSNETDSGNWSLIIPYIIHCLKFFDEDLNVQVSYVDEDLDWTLYDINDYCITEDGRFVMEISSPLSWS